MIASGRRARGDSDMERRCAMSVAALQNLPLAPVIRAFVRFVLRAYAPSAPSVCLKILCHVRAQVEGEVAAFCR